MAKEAATILAAPESVEDAETIRDVTSCDGSPKYRLKIQSTHTPPTRETSTPMSTTSAGSSVELFSCNRSDGSSSTRNSYAGSARIPCPSPSRSRLDRQYAKRLAASPSFAFHTPSVRSPSGTTFVQPVATPTMAATTVTPTFYSSSEVVHNESNSTNLLLPPGISRGMDPSIFRPSPIVTSSLSPTTEYMHQAPRKFFFPSTTGHGHAKNSDSSFSSYTHSNTSSSLLQRRRRTAGTKHSEYGISDRFIPSRATSNMNINLWESMNASTGSPRERSHSNGDGESGNGADGNGGTNDAGNNPSGAGTVDNANNTATAVSPSAGRPNDMSSITTQQSLLSILLRSELLGENICPFSTTSSSPQWNQFRASGGGNGSSVPFRDSMNRLRFQSPRQAYHDGVFEESIGPTSVVNSFSLTPFGSASSQRLMAAPQKRRRKIAKVPFKVLDAPALQDDFYLNLVDWSSQNVLAVGLGSCVYLWSACTSKVTKLCDLAQSEDIVTSVSWAQRGTHLAVGTNKGEVQLWDTIKVKKVRTMAGHSARVGTLAWTGPTLASGSRDRLIFLRDVRVQSAFTDRLNAHRQEVCGLKWSFDEPAFLASGGNDNQLHVVDSRNPVQPIHRFTDHTAAVKAIAWSPHQHGLLASGGGTADRCIRFWNTLSGSSLSSVDTGSQVCNLAWSQNCNEMVSTHGYSLNQIVVWRYPSLSKVVTLTGHTYRVLYLALSPDGSTIVTGAGDETLRFWQVFPGPRSDAKNNAGGLLFPNTLGSVIR
jgi:cell division cycle 20-like protein 1 (cofactor of APC complex)